jgi:ABC-type nitrate/sulfonate/bicarbonate transport system substrate-binding protein
VSQSQSSGVENVELWYSRCGAATASAIAIRKGWLQAEFSRGGTRLRSLRDSTDCAVLDSHYHHGLSGLFREGGNIPPIWARANGAETAVVGITWLDEYQGILSRSDSGIREIPDLLGKRLGLPLHGNLIDFQRGAALHGFVTALGLIGASASEVRFVDIPAQSQDSSERLWDDAARRNRPSVEVDALLSGKVDAIFLRSARGARFAQDPRFFQVIDIDKHPDPFVRVNNGTPRPITVDRRFLEEQPELVGRYLAVLLRTAAWAELNPAEVVELSRQLRSDPFADALLLADAASALHRVGAELEARRTFGELSERAPKDPWVRGLLGDRLRAEGWFDDATEAYATLEELIPTMRGRRCAPPWRTPAPVASTFPSVC